MQHVTLAAESRTNTGKGAARSLRREGKVPAVIYGHALASRPLTVEQRALGKVLELIGGEAALLDVSIDETAICVAMKSTASAASVARTPTAMMAIPTVSFFATRF